MSDQRIRPRERLLLQYDFDRVYRRRCRAGDGTLLIYVDRNEVGWSRLGLSVSRRFGSAVARNQLKRRIRETYRRAKSELPCGLDIVCVARRQPQDPAYDLPLALRVLIKRATAKLQSRRD